MVKQKVLIGICILVSFVAIIVGLVLAPSTDSWNTSIQETVVSILAFVPIAIAMYIWRSMLSVERKNARRALLFLASFIMICFAYEFIMLIVRLVQQF